ncbi:MAG: Methyltransferase type 11 [Chloroflexi bacterium]|nr:Methyltransferase type 11 [Chloroflexota bacterium]
MAGVTPGAGFFARRSPTAYRNGMRELLDGDLLAPDELAGNLREIRLINKGLGWTAATLHIMERVTRAVELRTFSHLDIATGSGDLPLAVLRRGKRRGWKVDAHALDANQEVLDVARRHIGAEPVTLHEGDARALPFASRSFDVVTCALALHHFEPHDAALVLSELERVARRAWIVVDIERGFPAYLGARVLRVVLRNRLTRHDAPASVLRAYSLPEFRDLLTTAAIPWQVAAAQFPFRLVGYGLVASESGS